MKRRTTLVLVLVLVIFFAGLYGYKEYNRAPADLSKLNAELLLDARALVEDYLSNEEAANKKYLGNIIEVRGRIVSSERQNLIIGDVEAVHNVSCTLDSARHATASLPEVGKQVIVRGVCTGFLIDVELNRCVLVND